MMKEEDLTLELDREYRSFLKYFLAPWDRYDEPEYGMWEIIAEFDRWFERRYFEECGLNSSDAVARLFAIREMKNVERRGDGGGSGSGSGGGIAR